MGEETPKDWDEKIQDFADNSFQLASKGYRKTVDSTRSVVEKSKLLAKKGMNSSIDASKNLAKKGKKVVEKSAEETKKFTNTLQKSTSERIEGFRSRKNSGDEELEDSNEELRFIEAESLDEGSEQYSRLTVQELRIRLKLLGLAVNGKKNALVERLRSSMNSKELEPVSSVREDLEQRITLIEKEYPDVLKPLPPEPEFSLGRFATNLSYSVVGSLFMAYAMLVFFTSNLNPLETFSALDLSLFDSILPSFALSDQFPTLEPMYGHAFVALGIVFIFASGFLSLFRIKYASTLFLTYFLCVAVLGRLVFSFVADVELQPQDYRHVLHDSVLFSMMSILVYTPRMIEPLLSSQVNKKPVEHFENPVFHADKPYTDGRIDDIIQEGLNMDFRAEVAKPKPPRARAKFEAYEKILLCVSFVLWPFTIFMTMAYNNGLSSFTEYSSDVIQVASAWGLSLLSLVSLVRFDRSARGNGWYAKEKETYVGMMDLYSKAQAKHYEYVELRAAAEAQEILEKYPQLDKSKSGTASKA